MRIYLVGPLTGRSKDGIDDWRAVVKSSMTDADFIDPASFEVDTKEAFLTPERPKQALQRIEHGRLVVERNKLLIKSTDLVLANFIGAGLKASIGSIGELFLANAYGKPVVILREKVGNVHDHAMLNAIASRVCFSLEEGLVALKEFYVPRVA